MKMNGSDFVEGGTEPEHVAKLISILPKIDLAEITSGLNGISPSIERTYFNPTNLLKKVPAEIATKLKDYLKVRESNYPSFEGYNLDFAKVIKKANPNTVIACVGGFQTFQKMEQTLKAQETDIISLGRPFIRETDLCKKLYSR
jgi:2,4-dienoyl-CoA reductase-like NADH-dependent reductase (Old Yellow Enzyme family)